MALALAGFGEYTGGTLKSFCLLEFEGRPLDWVTRPKQATAVHFRYMAYMMS